MHPLVTYWLSIVVIFLILSFLVIIHELGHLWAAWWAGVTAEEFGIGYPPRAMKLFTWRKTLFSLNWIPVGGFVKMDGEEGYSEADAAPTTISQKKSLHNKQTNQDSVSSPFYTKTAWQRLVIVLAGPVVNIVFAIAAFTVFYSITGIPEAPAARIIEVQADSPAAAAQLPTDVELIALRVDETTTPIMSIDSAITAIKAQQGKTITLVTTGPCSDTGECQELAAEYQVYVRKPEELVAGQGAVGITFDTRINYRFYPAHEMPFRAMSVGFYQSYQFSLLILQLLGSMVIDAFKFGKLPDQLVGPVGIAAQAGQMSLANSSWLGILNMAGLISVNLAVINLLPIAPLDGGRAVFIVLGKLFNRQKVAMIEAKLNYGGMIALLALLLFITLSDILRIFRG